MHFIGRTEGHVERVTHLGVQYFSSAMPSRTHPGMGPECLYRWNGRSSPILSLQALKDSGQSTFFGMVPGHTQTKRIRIRCKTSSILVSVSRYSNISM